MSKYLFSTNELKPRYIIPGTRGRIDTPVFFAPITAKENFKRAIFKKEPVFIPDYKQYLSYTPRIFPDIEARGFIMDGGKPMTHPEGFKDIFGVTWKFIEVVGGAMVAPGEPMIKDMNDWKDILTWPDVNAWNWEKQREISKDFFTNTEQLIVPIIMNGYFERLISLMDFEGAAIALIDEDQEDAIHEFLDKVADLYIQVIDKYVEFFPIDGISIHDDWGSQRAPFFSLKTAQNMLVPHIKKVSDHVHALGLFYDMHCCGQVEDLIPAMIEAGVDTWTGQDMNDKAKLYHLYGKEILIGVDTPVIPVDMEKEEIDKLAKAYVDEFTEPGAPMMIGYASQVQNPYFLEVVYRLSREKLCR